MASGGIGSISMTSIDFKKFRHIIIMTVASPVTDMISYKNSTSSAWGRMRISASQRIDKLTTVPSCRNQRTSKVVKEKGVQSLLQT